MVKYCMMVQRLEGDGQSIFSRSCMWQMLGRQISMQLAVVDTGVVKI